MPDDSTGGDGAPPASVTARFKTAVRRFFASPARRDAAAIVIGLISGGVGAIVGAAALPVWVMVVLTMLVAAQFLTIERAATTDTAEKKVRWLWGALAVALVLPVGSWAYHLYDSDGRETYPFYVEGENLLYSAGKPGGMPLLSGDQVWPGNSYDFECVGKDSKGAVWIKAAAGNYWYPAALLSPVGDFDTSDMPTCD
ncbi:hypothetical protein [Streptomyces sp. Ag109_G2-15]|uniref:hypothetical protein n=1 Tax=Streptomyces sp. Ag109_G2-15 TaxID=1938850 RepID=UPI000BC38124|nr:hypothetical protein [Streptomyces sp. Ag109_G2-15]SOD87664.1 hypothetical protein SAMN06272765_5156 [Streptomyces sp. Ag109_G2-15]